MIDILFNRINLLKGATEEVKVLYLYRYISLIITSFFYLIGRSEASFTSRIIVIVCLSMASTVLSYIYIKYQGEKNVVKVLIIIETIGNTLVLIPTGGLSSPYLWYSLNTVLVTAYYFNMVFCALNVFFYLACSAGISFLGFTNQQNDVAAADILLYNSNLVLSFILIAVAVQLLIALTKKLNIERKAIFEVNNQLMDANKRIQGSIEYVMSLYQVVYSLINIRNKSRLINTILYYTKEITKASATFFYLLSDKKDNELETNEDISLETKTIILEEIKKQLETIVKSSNTPVDLNIDNRVFKVIIAKSESKIYGVLGIELNRGNKDALYVETISQLKFLSSLISIVLERLALEEINEGLLIAEEQNRIAREIHDSVCQRIFAINCMVHTLKQKCDKVSFDELKKEFDFIGLSLNKANKELRTTIYDLSLKGKQSTSFREEIENYIREIAKLNGISISFKMSGNQELLDQNLKKAVYRIISESIGNSARHGKCNKVQIILHVLKEFINLQIDDDGIGFDMETRTKGLGIQNMFDIVNYSNGQISIESLPGKGTSISILIPNKILVENIKGEVI